MNDSAPASNGCDRCGAEIPAEGWWFDRLTTEREWVCVCESCNYDLGAGPVDPDEMEIDDETPQDDAEFTQATEVYSGP